MAFSIDSDVSDVERGRSDFELDLGGSYGFSDIIKILNKSKGFSLTTAISLSRSSSEDCQSRLFEEQTNCNLRTSHPRLPAKQPETNRFHQMVDFDFNGFLKEIDSIIQNP